jgi:hypothetical protein
MSLGTVLGVLRSLGALDRLVDAVDPYQSDLGRARASSVLPKRVRHRPTSPFTPGADSR